MFQSIIIFIVGIQMRIFTRIRHSQTDIQYGGKTKSPGMFDGKLLAGINSRQFRDQFGRNMT